MKKDVIYIDVEDDITTIIAKVKAAKLNIVALVPPKRSTVLQSAVNMKLLKRAAKDADKKLVLVSSEATLMPLAGAAGLYVAKSLQSKPEVPPAPTEHSLEDTALDAEPELDPTAPIGELAGDVEEPEAVEPAASSKTKTVKKSKTKKKSDIPNFERFRNKLLIGGAVLILLIVVWVVAFRIIPKADITILARASQLNSNVEFTVDNQATDNDIENKVLAGEQARIVKTETETFEATGEKNVGEKASGTMTVVNRCYNPGTLPAGTTFSSGSLNFVSTQAVSVPDSALSEGSCSSPSSVAVPVRAAAPGDQYNLAETTYAIAGYSKSDVYGSGNQMSGGTTEVAKVVSADDIKKASEKLLATSFADVRTELREELGEGFYAIEASFRKTNQDVVATPKAGQQANEGTVSAEFVFTITGVDQTALAEVLEASQQESLSGPNQSILDNGLETAETEITGRSAGVIEVKLSTSAFVGPDINTEELAEEVSGKRFSEVQKIVLEKEGVRSAEIDFSPFWVFSAPKASRVNIEVELSEASVDD